MIESLHIKDFQKHKDLELSFKKGLNVIVGHTDAGKSAIFRALNFCLYNQHKGVNHVRLGQKFSDVTCTIHGKKIRRVKGASKNFYEVDGLELKAFGAGLPEEVSQATKMDDINIQGQHDNIFLLADSPGAVARYLNKLINIDIIDRTMSSLGTAQLEAGREVTSNALECDKVVSDLSDIKFIKKCRKKFEDIKQGFKCQEDSEAELKSLEKCIAELRSVNQDTIDLEPMKESIKKMVGTIKNSEELIQEGLIISRLASSYPEIPDVDCEEFRAIAKEFDANTSKAAELRLIRNKMKEFRELTMDFEEHNHLEGLRSELKEACKICPTCGKDWC